MFDFNAPPPIFPVMGKLQPDSKIYLHEGEDKAKFLEFLKLISYLQGSFKFLPNFEQDIYFTGSPGDKTAPGIGSYPDPNLWGFDYEGKVGEDLTPRYGDVHHNELNGNYWGTGKGTYLTNIDSTPAAWQSIFLTDEIADEIKEELEKPVNSWELAKLLFSENNDDDPDNDKTLEQIKEEDLKWARLYLKDNFGDKSYYEIIMTGMDKTYIGADEKGEIDYGNISYGSGFLYEGLGPEAANALAISMLNDKYAFYYASAKVFGPLYNIKNNDSLSMASYFDNFINVEMKGVDQANLKNLALYFEIMHPLRSFLIAPTGGKGYKYGISDNDVDDDKEKDEGFNGNVYTAKDLAGYKKFRKWLSDNVSGDAASLLKESHKGYLPFNKKNNEGWDRFIVSLNESDPPFGLNPLAPEDGEVHPEYAISQLKGLNGSMLKGYKPLVYNGKAYDLKKTNWVVNLEGTFEIMKSKSEGKNFQTFAKYSLETGMYQINNRRYRDKKSEVKEEKREREYEEALANAKAAAKSKATTKTKSALKKNKSAKVSQKMPAQGLKKATPVKAQNTALNKPPASKSPAPANRPKNTSKNRS